MKTLVFTIALCVATFVVNATVLTVSNDPAQPAQFSSIPVAIDSAKANDTIYILGSNTVYPSLNITKSNLTFIGAGFNPNKQNPAPTHIDRIVFLEVSGVGVRENINFLGIRFSSADLSYGTNGIFRRVSFFRCMFASDAITGLDAIRISSRASQILIQECIIRSITNTGTFSVNHGVFIGNNTNITNILFQNNVFHGAGVGLSTAFLVVFENSPTALSNNIIFANNIFHKTTGGTSSLFLVTGGIRQGIIFTNNIFDSINPTHPNVHSVTYSNNLINMNVDLNNPTALGSIGSNNIINQNPQFVNYPAGAGFSFAHNYNLQPSSQAKGSGTNGTDMGVMGGNGKFRHDGEPFIPQIDELVIFNPVVPQGTGLQIRIKGTALDK
jgi:hypothetical protein